MAKSGEWVKMRLQVIACDRSGAKDKFLVFFVIILFDFIRSLIFLYFFILINEHYEYKVFKFQILYSLYFFLYVFSDPTQNRSNRVHRFGL